MDWALMVPEDSAIHDLQDLKGKAIGGGKAWNGRRCPAAILYAGQRHRSSRDVQLVPVGVGPLAMQALKSDKVQGLIYWGSAIAAFENFAASSASSSIP